MDRFLTFYTCTQTSLLILFEKFYTIVFHWYCDLYDNDTDFCHKYLRKLFEFSMIVVFGIADKKLYYIIILFLFSS